MLGSSTNPLPPLAVSLVPPPTRGQPSSTGGALTFTACGLSSVVRTWHGPVSGNKEVVTGGSSVSNTTRPDPTRDRRPSRRGVVAPPKPADRGVLKRRETPPAKRLRRQAGSSTTLEGHRPPPLEVVGTTGQTRSVGGRASSSARAAEPGWRRTGGGCGATACCTHAAGDCLRLGHRCDRGGRRGQRFCWAW